MLNANHILAALEEQLGCYGRLAKLAEQQHEHVQHGHMEALLDVLKGRQEVLGDISRLELIVGPAKRAWTDFIGGVSGEERAKLQDVVARSRQLLEQIAVSDKNDTLALQQQKLSVGKQIGQATSGRAVARSYATAAYGKAAPRMDVQR